MSIVLVSGFIYQEAPNATECRATWNTTYTCAKVTDGEWDTYGEEGLGVFADVIINYTKPAGALTTSLWQIKDAGGTTNLSITSDCWNLDANQVSFMVASTDIPDQVIWRCCKDDGCDTFDAIRTDATDKRAYEEAMWWEIEAGGADSSDYVTLTLDENPAYVADSPTYVILILEVDPLNTCSYSSGDWEVDCGDYCNITENVYAGGNIIVVSGTGYFNIMANITTDSFAWTAGTCQILNIPGDGNELRIVS